MTAPELLTLLEKDYAINIRQIIGGGNYKKLKSKLAEKPARKAPAKEKAKKHVLSGS